MDIRPVKICPLVWGVKIWDFLFQPRLCETQSGWTDNLRMCGSHCEVRRSRWDGALLVTLSVIYLEFKAHLPSMATTAFCSDTPSHPVCTYWDYRLFFIRTMTQHTSRLCKGYLTKKQSDGVLHQMTWPQQSPNLNPIEMISYELDESVGKAANKCSAYVGTPSRLLEKHPGWSRLRECQECAKLSSRQRVATLNNLNHFCCYMIPYVIT